MAVTSRRRIGVMIGTTLLGVVISAVLAFGIGSPGLTVPFIAVAVTIAIRLDAALAARGALLGVHHWPPSEVPAPGLVHPGETAEAAVQRSKHSVWVEQLPPSAVRPGGAYADQVTTPTKQAVRALALLTVATLTVGVAVAFVALPLGVFVCYLGVLVGALAIGARSNLRSVSPTAFYTRSWPGRGREIRLDAIDAIGEVASPTGKPRGLRMRAPGGSVSVTLRADRDREFARRLLAANPPRTEAADQAIRRIAQPDHTADLSGR